MRCEGDAVDALGPENRIDCPLQSPPLPCGASASTSGSTSPDPIGIRFSFPASKKQSVVLSGDQNGDSVAVVFISGRPFGSSRARIQKRFRPSTMAPNQRSDRRARREASSPK